MGLWCKLQQKKNDPPNGRFFSSLQTIQIKVTLLDVKWVFRLTQWRKLFYIVSLQGFNSLMFRRGSGFEPSCGHPTAQQNTIETKVKEKTWVSVVWFFEIWARFGFKNGPILFFFKVQFNYKWDVGFVQSQLCVNHFYHWLLIW